MDKLLNVVKIVLTKLYNVSGLERLSLRTVLIFFLLTLLALFIEYFLITDKRETSIYKLLHPTKSIFNDIISWFIDAFELFTLGGVLLTLGSFYFISVWIYKHPEYHLHLGGYIDNHVLQFILLFILRDLKVYWIHRLFHAKRPLWNLHSFHHSSDSFVSISAHRGHFVEGMISGVFDAVLFLFVGGPLINFVYISYLKELHFLLTHSNIKSNWGFVGKYILISPLAHRLHHSDNPVHFNKNFGGLFVFWDKIFGTYYHLVDEQISLGVPHSHYNKKNYLYDMVYSYYLFVKGFLESFTNLFKTKKVN